MFFCLYLISGRAGTKTTANPRICETGVFRSRYCQKCGTAFLQTRFVEFDLNKDAVLDSDEFQKMTEKLSECKRP